MYLLVRTVASVSWLEILTPQLQPSDTVTLELARACDNINLFVLLYSIYYIYHPKTRFVINISFLVVLLDLQTTTVMMPNNVANVSNHLVVNMVNVRTWTLTTQPLHSSLEHATVWKDTLDLCVTNFNASKRIIMIHGIRLN